MLRFALSIAVAASASLLLCPAVRAQDGDPAGRPGNRPGWRGGAMNRAQDDGNGPNPSGRFGTSGEVNVTVRQPGRPGPAQAPAEGVDHSLAAMMRQLNLTGQEAQEVRQAVREMIQQRVEVFVNGTDKRVLPLHEELARTIQPILSPEQNQKLRELLRSGRAQGRIQPQGLGRLGGILGQRFGGQGPQIGGQGRQFGGQRPQLSGQDRGGFGQQLDQRGGQGRRFGGQGRGGLGQQWVQGPRGWHLRQAGGPGRGGFRQQWAQGDDGCPPMARPRGQFGRQFGQRGGQGRQFNGQGRGGFGPRWQQGQGTRNGGRPQFGGQGRGGLGQQWQQGQGQGDGNRPQFGGQGRGEFGQQSGQRGGQAPQFGGPGRGGFGPQWQQGQGQGQGPRDGNRPQLDQPGSRSERQANPTPGGAAGQDDILARMRARRQQELRGDSAGPAVVAADPSQRVARLIQRYQAQLRSADPAQAKILAEQLASDIQNVLAGKNASADGGQSAPPGVERPLNPGPRGDGQPGFGGPRRMGPGGDRGPGGPGRMMPPTRRPPADDEQ